MREPSEEPIPAPSRGDTRYDVRLRWTRTPMPVRRSPRATLDGGEQTLVLPVGLER